MLVDISKRQLYVEEMGLTVEARAQAHVRGSLRHLEGIGSHHTLLPQQSVCRLSLRTIILNKFFTDIKSEKVLAL